MCVLWNTCLRLNEILSYGNKCGNKATFTIVVEILYIHKLDDIKHDVEAFP